MQRQGRDTTRMINVSWRGPHLRSSWREGRRRRHMLPRPRRNMDLRSGWRTGSRIGRRRVRACGNMGGPWIAVVRWWRDWRQMIWQWWYWCTTFTRLPQRWGMLPTRSEFAVRRCAGTRVEEVSTGTIRLDHICGAHVLCAHLGILRLTGKRMWLGTQLRRPVVQSTCLIGLPRSPRVQWTYHAVSWSHLGSPLRNPSSPMPSHTLHRTPGTPPHGGSRVHMERR
mmetsp:Transcript_34110/g.90983  ORF Transcript_34110/g.90983 Transcript_34110/m.90983 type:complete len:225 (+) Transcript_34110:2505-3179(+)